MDKTCTNVEHTKMITIGIWKWKIVMKNLAVNQIKKVVFLSTADNTIIKDDPIEDFHVICLCVWHMTLWHVSTDNTFHVICLCVWHMTLWYVSTDNTSVNWIINVIKILITE